MNLNLYETVLDHGDFFKLYGLIERDSAKCIRATIFNKQTGKIIGEKYIPFINKEIIIN